MSLSLKTMIKNNSVRDNSTYVQRANRTIVDSNMNRSASHSRSCPCDGSCPRCAPVIQAKLKIGQPNDKYDQEIDLGMHMAELEIGFYED